jgi:hypothetical protein
MNQTRLILVLATAPLVSGNEVPRSTEQQLTGSSDIVIVGTVMRTGISVPPGPSDKFEKGQLVMGSIATSPCVKVRVDRALKGAPARLVQICRHRIAELNAKPVRLGKRYRFFLKNAGATYVPTSWDAFKELQ